MITQISKQKLVGALRDGVARTKDLIAIITDYHGGPVTTEYLLTSDIAREFIERDYEIKVECLNRSLVNAKTKSKAVDKRTPLGSKRTDIVLLNTPLIPIALVEVKVGVRTLNKVRSDLDKVSDTIARLKPEFSTRVIGAVVFQVHVRGCSRDASRHGLKTAIEKDERNLRLALQDYSSTNPGFEFELEPLQPPDAGIVHADEDKDGHVTRHYAILIVDKRRAPSPPRSLNELK